MFSGIGIVLMLLLPVMIIPVMIVEAPKITYNLIKDWVVGWFDNSEERAKEWVENIYPSFERYSSYTKIEYAEAISCYYYMDTGINITDKISMQDYMNYFGGTYDLNTVYMKLSEDTGYSFSEEAISRIDSLKGKIAALSMQSKTFKNKVSSSYGSPVAEPIEKAITWATDIANDDIHGYSQTSRYGPDYDCSSFVNTAMAYAGFNVPISATFTMQLNYTGLGDWIWIPRSELGDISVYGVAAGNTLLKRGDILLNTQTHTEIYLGDGMNIGAHWDWDGRPGDSSGTEINIAPYWDSNWEGVLRYIGS